MSRFLHSAEHVPSTAEFLLELVTRSFLPLLACLLLTSTLLWGPWWTLGLAYAAWDLIHRVA